ncbi:MAG: hypothetical protein ACRDOM_10245 [Nocardioides sp.]
MTENTGDKPNQDILGAFDGGEDVEAHRHVRVEGADEAEDVEGHRRVRADGVEDEEDVEGHMQPPRDLDIER